MVHKRRQTAARDLPEKPKSDTRSFARNTYFVGFIWPEHAGTEAVACGTCDEAIQKNVASKIAEEYRVVSERRYERW